MKGKNFSIKNPKVKGRKRLAPPSKPHKDKRNDYRRSKFKDISEE